MLPRSPTSVTSLSASDSPSSLAKTASMTDFDSPPSRHATRRSPTQLPLIEDKYRNANRDLRMRNDFKLIDELNKKLVIIREDIDRVVARKELFQVKKLRIVEVHDHAETLTRPRTGTRLPPIGSEISQPFGLHDFLIELGSFSADKLN